MAYNWIPAGMLWSFANWWYFFTYKNTGVRTVEVDIHDQYTVVRLPDREIYATKYRAFHPMDQNFDEVICTHPYEPNSILEQNSEWSLISAHSGMLENIRDRNWLNNKVKIFADSGGAQLKMNTTDYVDPVKVIDWFNRCADIGMSLDVPCRPKDHGNSDLYDLLIEATAANNKIFLERKREDLKLMNCVHGHKLEEARRWASRTQDERFYGWACAPDNKSYIANLRSLLVCMKEYEGQSDNHFHLFGFSGRVKAILISWLATKTNGAMTSDSSSWVKSASKMVYFAMDLEGQFKNFLVGARAQSERLVDGATLPCSCPICSRFKWWQYFSLPPRTGSITALSWHNYHMLHTISKSWSNLAVHCASPGGGGPEAYKALITRNLRNPTMVEYLHRGVDYIEEAMGTDLDKLEFPYKRWLGENPQTIGGMNKLFTPKEQGSTATNLSVLDSSESYVWHYLPDDHPKRPKDAPACRHA